MTRVRRSEHIPTPDLSRAAPSARDGPGTKRLALIAGGIGGALVLLVGGWSLIGHRSTGVPVIEADSRPMRVKPDNPGGMQVAGANEDILSGGADGDGGKLAPPPETPAPQEHAGQPAAGGPHRRRRSPAAPRLRAARAVSRPPLVDRSAGR